MYNHLWFPKCALVVMFTLSTGCLSPNGGLVIMYHWPFNTGERSAEYYEKQEEKSGIAKLAFHDPELWRKLDYRASTGWTRLTYATHCGRLDVVRYLVEHGENINGMTIAYVTALDVAVQEHHMDIESYLRSKGALESKQMLASGSDD
jgi:hypothetical protein